MSNTLRALFIEEEATQKQANIFARVLKKDTALEEGDIPFLTECHDKLQVKIDRLLDTEINGLSKENIDLLKSALKDANANIKLLETAINDGKITKGGKQFKALALVNFDEDIVIDYIPEVEPAPIEEIIVEEPVETEDVTEITEDVTEITEEA